MARSTGERRELIVEELTRRHMVKVSELSERFGVSGVSIRRDLNRLEQHGLLKRVHGGAVVAPNISRGQSYSDRTRLCMDEKERIGCAAAEMIHEGDRVIFDSGTTVLQVARKISGELLNSGNLSVITASLPIVHELGHWNGVHLILLGGIYLPNYEVCVGPQTINDLNELYVDKMFLGTDGLTLSHGHTSANVLEAQIVRAMIEHASEIITVADSSKIGAIGLTAIIPLNEIDKLITDTNAPSDFVAALEEQGVEVILV